VSLYATFYGALLFHKTLEKHLEKYRGLQILHMSNMMKQLQNAAIVLLAVSILPPKDDSSKRVGRKEVNISKR